MMGCQVNKNKVNNKVSIPVPPKEIKTYITEREFTKNRNMLPANIWNMNLTS
jgi:hypothetical protein